MVDVVEKGPHADAAKGMEADRDEARPLAEKQAPVARGNLELPAREMLGDMLLEMNRSEDALAEYERSLKTDPNRFNGLYAAARAAE